MYLFNDYLNKKLKILSKAPTFRKKNHEFSLLLTNDKQMKYLNLKFRKKNKTTDVLSFPLKIKDKKKLYIGDIAAPRGGPRPYGHQSHQTGLDVDIWLTPPKSLTLTKKERDNIKALSVRKKNLKEVNKNWTLVHAKILREAALDNRVDRIFINAPAKIWMCENIQGSKKWLQKIRPIWGHHSHFHVRLKCPQDSTECITQRPTVSEISKSLTGCDETLYWWVTKALEPADPSKKKPPSKKKKGARDYTMDDLPEMCLDVIHSK